MKTFLALAASVGCASAINAPNVCKYVQVPGGTICLKDRGNAFQHWTETEDGFSVCSRMMDGGEHYFYANGSGGDNGALSCSDIEVTAYANRGESPADQFKGRYIPKSSATEEEEVSGAQLSFVQKVAAERGRSLQAAPKRLKNLVILIRWNDDKNNANIPGKSVYEAILTGKGPTANAPTGSVNDIFNANMYGKVIIETTVVGWVDSRYTHSQATGSPLTDGKTCGGTCSSGNPMLRNAILEALAEVDGKYVNIGDFDKDGDGMIDLFTVIHSGHGAETVGGRNVGQNWIWSHKWSLPQTYRSGNVLVRDYNVNPGLWSTTGFEPSRIGVIAHESFHFLGLPDLYDTDYSSSGISIYGLMANSWGIDGEQRYPPSLSAWSKLQLGVVTPLDVTESGVYEIPAVQDESVNSIIRLKMSDGITTYPDYLLIEFRAKKGFDILMDGGILIWHVDPSKNSNTDESDPSKPSWPRSHYKVRLIQADGLFQLEQANGGHNSGDWFFKGNGAASARIDDRTVPSLNGYSLMVSGRCSGHALSDFSVRTGRTMTFRYTRMKQDCSGQAAETLKPTLSPTPKPSQNPTLKPTTEAPTSQPTTASPTTAPTSLPTFNPISGPQVPWNKVCYESFYNAGDGCDCGCGTIRDPDCLAGDKQSTIVYCDGSMKSSPGKMCDLDTNTCVISPQGDNGSLEVVSKTPNIGEQPPTNNTPSETSFVGPLFGVAGVIGVVAVGSVLFARRRRAQRERQITSAVPHSIVTATPMSTYDMRGRGMGNNRNFDGKFPY